MAEKNLYPDLTETDINQPSPSPLLRPSNLTHPTASPVPAITYTPNTPLTSNLPQITYPATSTPITTTPSISKDIAKRKERSPQEIDQSTIASPDQKRAIEPKRLLESVKPNTTQSLVQYREADVQTLRDQLESFTSRLTAEKAKQKTKDQQTKIRALENEHRELVANYNVAQNQLRTARQEAANAEKARAFLAKSTNTALQFANDQLASLIKELHTAEETNFNLKTFQHQIETSFKSTITTLQTKLKKETETWESLLLSKTNEITGLQDDLIKLNIEKNNTKTAVQDISKAYSDQLSREKGEVTKLKQEIEQLQEELSYTRQQYQTLDNQHKSSVLQLQTFVDQENSSITDLSETIQANKTILHNEREHNKATIANLQLQIDTLSKDLAQGKIDYINLRDQLSTNFTQFSEAEQKLKREIATKDHSLFQAKEEISKLSQFIATQKHDFETVLQNKEIALTQQQQELSIQNSQLLNLNSILQQLSQQNPHLNIPEGNMAVDLTPLLSVLNELINRDEKKAIPFFSGTDNITVTEWLRDCERLAKANSWDKETTWIKIFSSRLKGDALDWNVDYFNDDNLTNDGRRYDNWKKKLIAQFQTGAEIEDYRQKLVALKQRDDQKVKSFINRINFLYDIVHGSLKKLRPGEQATEDRQALITMREKEKGKILIKGLHKNLQQEFWPRLPADADFEQICKTAIEAETIGTSKQINQEKPIHTAMLTTNLDSSQSSPDPKIDTLIKAVANLTESIQKNNQINFSEQREYQQKQDRFYNCNRSGDRNNSRDRYSGRNFSGERNRSYSRDRGDRSRQQYGNDRTVRFRNNGPRSLSRSKSRDRHPTWPSTGDKTYQRSRSPAPTNSTPRERSASRERDQTIKCHRCERTGHFARECRTRLENLPRRDGRKNN